MKLEKSKVDEDVSESIADDLLLASLETHHPSGTKDTPESYSMCSCSVCAYIHYALVRPTCASLFRGES